MIKSLFSISILFINFNLVAQDSFADIESFELISEKTCTKPTLPNCHPESDTWKCTLDEITGTIISHLKYPSIARENNREGSVLIQLIIDNKGHVIECETLNHFGSGSDKALKKMYKKSNIMNLQFSGLDCMENHKYLKLKIPVTFLLESKNYPSLWDLEQIFCERSQHFRTQTIKTKRFKKELKNSLEINDYWLYKNGLTRFNSFNLELITADGSKYFWSSIESLDSKAIDEMKNLIKKGDRLIFEITDSNSKGTKVFKKRILLK